VGGSGENEIEKNKPSVFESLDAAAIVLKNVNTEQFENADLDCRARQTSARTRRSALECVLHINENQNHSSSTRIFSETRRQNERHNTPITPAVS